MVTDETATRGFADLAGRRAIVTGASSGIGRETALELARGGADVLVHAANNRDGAEETAGLVCDLGRTAEVALMDFRSENIAAEFADRIGDWAAADIFVGNAGADLLTTDARNFAYADKLALLWEVDVRAGLLLAKDFCERMRRRHGETGVVGSVVTIGWDQAATGMDGDSGELFAAAKSAVMSGSKSLAATYAPAVRVNCVAPGWIRTAWGDTAPAEWQERVLRETPLKRWGEPTDIAQAIRFLASDAAEFVTGQVLNVNGGAVR